LKGEDHGLCALCFELGACYSVCFVSTTAAAFLLPPAPAPASCLFTVRVQPSRSLEIELALC
jgi:hypothetical protein